MSKRKYDGQFIQSNQRRQADNRSEQIKKHTLDSDEEDNVDEGNVLDADDIEGEEDGIARQVEGQRLTAFNMKEEMEEGHFDKQGHFIWNNEKEIRDNWLDNIDWQKIKTSSNSKDKYNIDEDGLGASSESENEAESTFDELITYKKMIEYMKPKETVNKTIKRLGGADMKLSSVERLRRKKAGTLNNNEDVTNMTELANQILSNMGNMDVYQETFEQIQKKIDSKENKHKEKEPELDMYSDDFDVQEKKKMNVAGGSSSTVEDDENSLKPNELLWEFKWTADDEKIEGPFNTAQMIKWSKDNYFKNGVLVRKCGESTNFYTSNRIDFELYE